MTQQSAKQNQKGFTLIEAVVATFLFVLVVSAIMSTYSTILDLNRRTDATRTASQDARYYEEFLSKELRNMQGFDYAGKVSPCTSGAPAEGGVSSLGIINIDGDYECFYSSGSNLVLAKSSAGQLLSPQNMNSAGVTVSNVQFYVSPACMVYSTGAKSQMQVTFTASFTARSGTPYSVTIPIESTVSIPKYDFAYGNCS